MFAKLEGVENRRNQLEQALQEPGIAEDQKKYRSLMKELADIQPVVETFQNFKAIEQELSDNKELLNGENDPELKSMAREEISRLEPELEKLRAELKILLIPKDPNDDKNVIVEIRAGAGGDEASLFAQELFRAYTIFAGQMNWQVENLSASEGNAGGFKEVIAMISGDKVFSQLKFESGVHRVQRVPETETQGRVHTSTVTVAVLPEAEDVDFKLDMGEVRVDVQRASGSGGQSVNRTESAVRLTHLPTGIIVYCQDGKSQHANKDKAIKVLQSRLLALEEEKARKDASDARISQIGTGDRSERIRTYNFPQSRITDHRIGLTIHSIGEVMQGSFKPLIEPLIAHYQAEILKHQNDG